MDKIFDDTDLITRRFSCECLFPGHILDVSIELADERARIVQCTLNLYMDGKASFKWRLKEALGLLRGQEGSLADFILRVDDIPALIEVLKQAIPISYTTGTTVI